MSIAALRLRQQCISQPQAGPPEAVLSWMLAIQGQDYAGAKWSLGLRQQQSSEAQVEGAVAEGRILRSWLFRGTLHLVCAADLPWLLALLSPRIIAGNARRYRELELDEATLARSSDLLGEALADGRQAYRAKLLTLLESAGISTAGQRGFYMLQHASLLGLLCQGPPRGPQNLFRRVEGTSPALSREEALALLALRYFSSRGPATLADFVWWSGLPTGDARLGLEGAASQLIEARIDGETYWQAESSIEAAPAAGFFLLPGFDEFLLAYRNRSAVLDPAHAQRITPGANGVFHPYLVIDGRVRGLWRFDRKRSKAEAHSEAFDSAFPIDGPGFDAAVARYLTFLT